MDANFTEDLRFEFNSSPNSFSKKEHDDKAVFNFNHDGDSQNDIKNSSKQMIHSNCQSIHNGNKDTGDDLNTKDEELLLCIEDEEGDFDEYELTEEEENYLLREDCPEHYIKVNGMILWNADEYDFTEEQENILLSDDCPIDYLKNLDISNLNKVYTVDHEDNLLSVDLTPSSLTQNIVCVQENRSNYINCGSNLNSSDGKEYKSLSSSIDEENEIIRNFSTIPTQQIKSEDLLHNSSIKSQIPSNLNDAMKKQGTVTNVDDEDMIEIEIILDIEDVEDFFIKEDDENNPQSLYNPFFPEPTEITNPQTNYFSSKFIPMNSSTTEKGKDNSSEDSNTNERVGNKKFDVSKIMKSQSARRAYLNLLKDKTDSLLRSYNEFKSNFLQSPSRIIEELELNKSFSEKENVPAELCNDPKKIGIKMLNKNKDDFRLTNSPLVITVENKIVQSICQFNNQDENGVERVKRRSTFSKHKTNEEDLTQLRDSEEIQDKTLEQITPESSDECIKDILDVPPFTNNPLNFTVQYKTVQSRCQFNNHDENGVDSVKRRLIFSKQNAYERNLTQCDSEEIEDETLEKIVPNSSDEYIKDILDKNVSETSLEEKIFCSVGGVVCNIHKEGLPYGIVESRHSNIPKSTSSEKVSQSSKQIQNENREKNCDKSQTLNMSGLRKCFTPDPFSFTKKDIGNQERNDLNEPSQKFTGRKFTEILNSHLFEGYETMNSHSINDDSSIVSDVNEIEICTSKNLRKRPKLNYTTCMNLRKRPALNYSTSMNLRKRRKLN